MIHHNVEWKGISLDSLDIDVTCYETNPDLLQADSNSEAKEVVTSELLKSNCPLTGQPDYGSVLISYEGPRIDHSSLLKYIISYRMHNGFHEQCVEQMYTEIMSKCKPTKLGVYARFTRRGGMDINPYRHTHGFNFVIQNKKYQTSQLYIVDCCVRKRIHNIRGQIYLKCQTTNQVPTK